MDLEYDEKFAEMKKYIPFLENMIKKLEYAGSGGVNPREAQLRKIKSLRNLLLDHSKKMKMENLRKCEQVLINLYAKVEQNDTLPGVSKTLPDVRIQQATKNDMSELRSVRERLQKAVISQDPECSRHPLMSVCHKVEKEPALFQRRPSKPSTASSGDSNDASSDPLSKRKYTRLLVSPEPKEKNWLDSETPLYHRRTPKKSPKKRSPRKEKKGLYKRDRNKHRDCEEINITLNVPKKQLSSLNTEDILDRIISCQNNDVDIDQLSSLRSQIIQELKQTGGNQDISDFILKSYKNKNKQNYKKDEVEEGELSDSESESIEKVYGNLVIELKNDLNDQEDQSNLDFFSSRSTNDENNTQKIKITLVSSKTETESSVVSSEKSVDGVTDHNEEIVPSKQVKSKPPDYSQNNDILKDKPTDNKDSNINIENQISLDEDKTNKPNLANFYVPLLQDNTLTNSTLDNSKNNTLNEQTDCLSNLPVSSYQSTESQEKETQNKKLTEYNKSRDDHNKKKDITVSSDEQLNNTAKQIENTEIEVIPLLSNDSKKPHDVKNNTKISEIDILKALKNEILSESIDVPNTSNTPALHLPKISKVTDKNILDNKKKRISLEKYKEKSICTTKTPLFVNDPSIKSQENQPKKQSRGLTEKECDRFKFFANSCVLSSDDESDCKDINDMIYANLTPKSPERQGIKELSPLITKETKEEGTDLNVGDVDMRKAHISPVSIPNEPKRTLSTEENTDMVLSPSLNNTKINENLTKDPRHKSKDIQNIQKLKDPRKSLVNPIPGKVTEITSIQENQNASDGSKSSNHYINHSYGRTNCPTTPSHPFGRSDYTLVTSHPFGRSDCPTTPSHPFGRSDCPTTPSHPFGRSDCPTTPNHPFGRSDCPTTPSHPFGRSDCPTTPSNPFGRSDCPTTPSHPFGRSDCPTTPSHPFGRSDCPTTPSNPFGRSDCPTTPSHPFGRSDCPATPSHPFGRSDCPTTPSHPFGSSECPRTPSHPFGRSDCPPKSNHYGRSERSVTPNHYSRYERSSTPSSTFAQCERPSTPSYSYRQSDCSGTSNHKYRYSDGPSKPNYNFGRSEQYLRHSNEPEYVPTGNSFNRSDRSNSAYRHTHAKTYDNSDFTSSYSKYKNDDDAAKKNQKYPFDNNSNNDFNNYFSTYNKHSNYEVNNRSFSRDSSKNFRRESSIPRDQSNFSREQSVPRREQSIPPREQNVSRREQSVSRREQSVSRREQSVSRREQSVPRREQSVSRREQCDFNDPRRKENSSCTFVKEFKDHSSKSISKSLAIGFDNRSFIIDTNVSSTFQNATFEDRRRRASSVGRFDTDNVNTNQLSHSIDKFPHFRSNFTRARSVGRDFNKELNSTPKIEFDFKKYISKISEQANKAHSGDKTYYKEKYNIKKHETINMRDPRNRNKTNSFNVTKDINIKTSNTQDLHRNRDPRLNRRYKESPNKFKNNRYSNERRYESNKKYGIVYTNDNIAKGNILGPGYGVKNYKIPKIKRVEEEKIETSDTKDDVSETEKSNDIHPEKGKEKLIKKESEKLIEKSNKMPNEKSKEIVTNESKEMFNKKAQESIQKSNITFPKKCNNKLPKINKKDIISENAELKSLENININKILLDNKQNNSKDDQSNDPENISDSSKECKLNVKETDLTENQPEETKIKAAILKEVNENSDDDSPICTRTRRRRKTLKSETDSENNSEILKSTPILCLENSSDIDSDNKANNSFDSRDLDLFSDTDKDPGVIDNIIANLDKEIDNSILESKNSCIVTSNTSKKDTTFLSTENTQITKPLPAIKSSKENTLETIDKYNELDSNIVINNSNITNIEKKKNFTKDKTTNLYCEDDVNVEKYDKLLPTSTALPVPTPKDNSNCINNRETDNFDKIELNKTLNKNDKHLEDATVSTSNLINETVEPNDSDTKTVTDNTNINLISPSTITKINEQKITLMSTIENEVLNFPINKEASITNNINSANISENISNILPDSTNELPTDSDLSLNHNRENYDEPKKSTSDDSKLKVESLGNLLSILQDKTKIKELLNMITESTDSEKIKRKLEKLTTIVSDDEETINEIKEEGATQCNKFDKSNEKAEKKNDNETETVKELETNSNKINKKVIKKKGIQKRLIPKKKRKKCAGKIVTAKNAGAAIKRVTRSGTLSGVLPTKPKKLKRELLMLQEDLKEVFSNSDSLINPSGLRQCRLTKLVNENNKANKKDSEENILGNYNSEETCGDLDEKIYDEKPSRKKPGPKPKLKANLNDSNVSKSEDQEKNLSKVKPGSKGKKYIESSETDPYELDIDNFSESTKTEGSPYTSEDEFLNKSFESSNSSKRSRVRRKNTPWQLGIISKKSRKKKIENEKTISKESSINENEIFVDKYYCFKKNEENYNCKFCSYQGDKIVNHYKRNHPHYEVPLSRFDPETSNAAIQQSLVTDFKKLQNIVIDKHVCRFCFEVFEKKVNNLQSFFSHVIKKHTGEYALKCSQCEDPKNCTYTLDVPLVPNEGLLLGFICGECNYTQLSLENLKTHVALRHDNEQTAVYAIDIGDLTEKKIKKLTKAKTICSNDNLPIKSIISTTDYNNEEKYKKNYLRKKPCPASKKIQAKITFENEESFETDSTVIKKEIICNEDISVISKERSVDDKLPTDPIPATPIVNRDKCATENLYTEAHFKIHITKSGIKEYACCINGVNHYKTSLFFSIKKHVQMKHKEIWDGYCHLCKVIVTTQGIHYFKDCLQHMSEKHLDDLPILELPDQHESASETEPVIKNISEQSSEVVESTKSYIKIRPMFELMAKVSEPSAEADNSDSMAFPRIESVISLNSEDCNVETAEEPQEPPFHEFESIQNKVDEPKQQMDIDAAQIEIFKDKHQVVIDTMLTPAKLVQYFKCAGTFCSFTCDSPEAAIVHVLSHQRLGGAGALKCAYCAFQVDNGIDLVSHVFQEHGHCQYSCSMCFYRAVSGSYVESHVQRAHKAARLQGSVLKAPALAPGSQIPTDQGRPLHTEVVPQYKCFKNSPTEGSCKFRHYTQDKFVEHLQHKHPNDTTFDCSFCPEKHDSIQSLLKHLQNHHINVYQCTWCVHGTSGKAAMMDHVSTSHPTLKVNPYIRRIVQKNEKAMRILPVVNIDKMTTTAVDVSASPSQDAPVKEVERAIQLENLIGATNKMIGADPASAPARSNTPVAPTDDTQEIDHLVEPPATPPPADTIQEQTTPVLFTAPTLQHSPTERTVSLDTDLQDSKQNIVTTALIDIPGSTVVVDLTEDETPPATEDETPSATEERRLSTQDLFLCGNCKHQLRTAAAYKRHVPYCKEVVLGQLRCAHCLHMTNDRADMVEHYINAHGKSKSVTFVCSICQLTEHTAKAIQNHMSSVHAVAKVKHQMQREQGGRKYVMCPVVMKKPPPKRKASGELENVPSSKKTFGPGDEDGLPINPILDEDVFCSVCDFRTKVRLNMVRHLAQHRDRLPVGSTAPVNPVPHLGSNEMHFDKMTNLASSSLQPARPSAAVRADSAAEPTRYPQYVADRTRLACGARGCGYISVDEATLKAHWDALHAGADHYRCVHCPPTQQLSPSVTLTAARIVAHLRMHDARLYACPHCSYYHNVRHVVEKHLRERHAQPADKVLTVREAGAAPAQVVTAPTMDLKPWQCGLCRYSSMLRSAVVDHCWNLHKSKTQLKCALCVFRSSERSKLDDHMTEMHSGRVDEPLYYFYREGSLPDEPDGTLRWQKQAKDYPETGRRMDEEPTVKPCASPPPPPVVPVVPVLDLNLVKSEVVEEVDMSESGLKASFGEFCDPKGNKFACPLCTTAALESKEAMMSHLYEELNYRKWACGLCTYKGFHRNGLMEHALFEHRKTHDPISLPPDLRIEKWVTSLIQHQELIILSGGPKVTTQMEKVPVITGIQTTPSVSFNVSEPTTLFPRELLENAFGSFGKSTQQEFACPKCVYKVKDEAKMTDHLEVELAKVRWICGICSQKFQTYHQVQLHSKCFHFGQPANILEASRDPSLRAAWIAAVIHSQRTHIGGHIATTEEPESRDDNSLLVVRYEENIPTPDATTYHSRDQPQLSDERSDYEDDDQYSSDSEPRSKKLKKQCKYCDYKYKLPRCLQIHMYKHYNLKPFKCRYCEFTSNRTQVKQHIHTKHKGLPIVYDMTVIPSSATLTTEIVKPGVYVGGGLTNSDCDVVCLVCENAYPRQEIYEHMEIQHKTMPYRFADKDTTVLKCCSCLTLWEDKEHLITHHIEEHRFQKLRYSLFKLTYGTVMACLICNRKLRRVRDLKQHHETYHCDQMYATPDVITESAPALPVKRPLEKDPFEASVAKKTARKSTTKLPG